MCMKGSYYCHGRCLGSRYRCPDEAEEPEILGMCFKGTYYCRSLNECVDNSFKKCLPELPATFDCEEGSIMFQGKCVERSQLEEIRSEMEKGGEPNQRCEKGTYFCYKTDLCVDNFSHECPEDALLQKYGCHKGQVYDHGHCYPPQSVLDQE